MRTKLVLCLQYSQLLYKAILLRVDVKSW